MQDASTDEMDLILDWCASVLGPVELLSDHSKVHGGHESATHRLRTPNGYCYLKVPESPFHWHSEVFAYEHWSRAFGRHAPALLALRAAAPYALVVSEIPGRILEGCDLDPALERRVWRDAGEALAALHDLDRGAYFGPCRRDGTPYGPATSSAARCVGDRLKQQIDRAAGCGFVSGAELAVVNAAYSRVAAFEGERPVPCHRDYCAANWIIDADGRWAGVIDFEFAMWDVRVADFSRDPDWNWIRRPDLFDALVEGYGREFTAVEADQLLVAHAEYALSAILWGREHAFYGFEAEGRESLARLARHLL